MCCVIEIANKTIINAAKWSSITEIIAKMITPVVNMILARLLTPEAFGVVATITMVISFAEVFADAGFQKYIIQHEFKNEEELNRNTNVAFWTNLVLSIIVIVSILFYRDTIATLVGNPELGDSIGVASVLILITAFSSIQAARYKREFDFKTLFYARIGTALIPLLITVPLAFVLHNYWAILIGMFVSQLWNAVILTINSKWKPRPYYSVSLLKEMFSFSAWTLLESIAIWLTGYMGVFIVGSYLNPYYLGLYKTSMTTVNSYMGLITSAITPVLFSSLSRYQTNEANFKRTYYGFQRIVAVLVFPMGIGIYIYSDLVTLILLGKQWMEASGFVGLWGLMGAFTIIFSHFSSEVYRSKGNPKISLLSQLIHLAFLIPVLLIFVNYDFEVLYIARSAVRIQGIIVALIIMKVLYGFKITTVIKNVLPMIFSAIIMGIIGYNLQLVNEHLLWQLVTVIICIAVYFVTLLGGFPKVRKEILEYCLQICKKKKEEV